MVETRAVINPFSGASKGLLVNKDPTVWPTRANLPTPMSYPPVGGSHPHTAQHTHRSKLF